MTKMAIRGAPREQLPAATGVVAALLAASCCLLPLALIATRRCSHVDGVAESPSPVSNSPVRPKESLRRSVKRALTDCEHPGRC